MDSKLFHSEITNLFSDQSFSPERLTAAEKAAYLELAHHVNIPEAEDTGTATVTSGTPNYTLSLTTGEDIDRLTAAVFVSGTTKNAMWEWKRREYLFKYRGEAESGTPYAWNFYKGQLWLYYIPDVSGTVYFDCQKVLMGITDFGENLYPVMLALTKKHLFRANKDSFDYASAKQEAKELIKSLKLKMSPIKSEIEQTLYRAQRIKDLNELI